MDLEIVLRGIEDAGGGDAARPGVARMERNPVSTSSRSSARLPRRAHGAGASRAITSRSTSPSSTVRSSRSAPSFFESNPAEVKEGPKEASGFSRPRKTRHARS